MIMPDSTVTKKVCEAKPTKKSTRNRSRRTLQEDVRKAVDWKDKLR